MSRDGIRNSGRRRSPRIEIDGSFRVLELALRTPMEMQDISVGGFRALSPLPLDPGTRHTIEVALPGRQPMSLVADVVYCLRVGTDGHTVGWKWASDSATGRGIVALLEHLTDARSYRPPVTPLSIISAKA